MKSPKIILTAIATLLTTTFALSPNLLHLVGSNDHEALAQTPDVLEARANQLLQLGIRQHKTGQFSASLASAQQALKLYRDINNLKGQEDALASLGDTYFSLGQYFQAIDSAQQQVELAKYIGDRPTQVKAMLTLSNAYFSIGQEDLAKQLQQQAMVVQREIGNPRGEAAFYGDVGIAYNSQREPNQAIAFYQQQLARAQKIGDRFAQAYALSHLGQVYQSQGKYQQAIAFYQQQLEVAHQTKDAAGEMNILNNIAEVYKSLGQYTQAIEVYQQQLALAKVRHNTGAQANTLNALVAAYRHEGQDTQVIDFYQQQLSMAKDQGDLLAEGTALNNLATISLKAGKSGEAKEELLDAMQIWQAMRAKLSNKDNYQQEQATTYQLLQQALIAQNQPQAALEIAEQGRFKGFLQLLGLRLSSESPVSGLRQLPKEITFPTLKLIQEIAKEQNATIVEYSITPDQGVYIWVIQPNGAIAFRRPNLSQDPNKPVSNIRDLVVSFRKSLQGSGNSSLEAEVLAQLDISKPLQQLHQLLIQPIEDQLPKDPTAHVIFIPQQELFLVPFAALVDPFGKYLIEKHTILTAPAIGLLKLSHQVRRGVRGDKALVVGNPTMPSLPPAIGQPPQPLPPLVNAEQEALEIAQLLKTKAFTGNQATKVALLPQLANNRYLHFATYGVLDEVKAGTLGAIALAPGGTDNGLLTPGEILSLPAKPNQSPLHAELVVISASETGQGRMTGNGIIGLSGSLIAAGVPSTIVALWSVPNAPTASFMTQFYRNFFFQRRHRDKAQALRQVMLTTMKQHPNPRDWAAFTLIGEAQ